MSAENAFTQTGVAAMRSSIERFSDDQTAALKAVAKVTAGRIHSKAQVLLLRQTRGEGNTADALKITDDSANKQFVVHFGLIRNRPANLPIWLEYGTVRMAARPFMRPAADEYREKYRSEMAMAAEVAARKTFGE